MEIDNKKYITECSSMRALLWESKLEEVPNPENFWTFDPEENDLALVNGVEYIFKEGAWIEYGVEEDE